MFMEVSELIFIDCFDNSHYADGRCPRDCGCDDDGGCVER